MANVMSVEKRNTILRLLVEGNSIRSVSRLMGSQILSVTHIFLILSAVSYGKTT